MNSQCYLCHLRKNVDTVRKLAGEAAATSFTRDMMALYLRHEGNSSPILGPETDVLIKKYCGVGPERFREEKQLSNRFFLERIDSIRDKVASAQDPLFAGLQMAILGNYIDFSALYGEVSFDKMEKLLEDALQMELDWNVYQQFRKDCESGKQLLYITDNAGEIGFDRVFAETIQKTYPHLQITFCVRGGEAANDATQEDADAVGVPFPVVDNGCPMAGTDISRFSPETRALFDNADVIISKGQANLETMYHCGRNVYYAFLVKCILFMELFQKPKLTPMFIQDPEYRS